MIPVTQTKVVIRNSNGEEVVRGNCFAAVIASILEVPITEVPNVETLFHINDYPWWSVVMDAWLKSKGWELWGDYRYKVFHCDMESEEYMVLAEYYMQLRGKYYLASGLSARGVHHICIYMNGQLVWDPHPSREGLLTFENFQTLEKIKADEK